MTTGYAEQLMEPFHPHPGVLSPIWDISRQTLINPSLHPTRIRFLLDCTKSPFNLSKHCGSATTLLHLLEMRNVDEKKKWGNYRFYTAETRFTQNIKVSREIHFLVLFPRVLSVLYTSPCPPLHHPRPFWKTLYHSSFCLYCSNALSSSPQTSVITSPLRGI